MYIVQIFFRASTPRYFIHEVRIRRLQNRRTAFVGPTRTETHFNASAWRRTGVLTGWARVRVSPAAACRPSTPCTSCLLSPASSRTALVRPGRVCNRRTRMTLTGVPTSWKLITWMMEPAQMVSISKRLGGRHHPVSDVLGTEVSTGRFVFKVIPGCRGDRKCIVIVTLTGAITLKLTLP